MGEVELNRLDTSHNRGLDTVASTASTRTEQKMAGGGPEAANTVAELRPALELVDDDGNPNWIPDVSVMDLEDVEGFGLGDNEADDGDDEDERLAKAGFFPYEA